MWCLISWQGVVELVSDQIWLWGSLWDAEGSDVCFWRSLVWGWFELGLRGRCIHRKQRLELWRVRAQCVSRVSHTGVICPTGDGFFCCLSSRHTALRPLLFIPDGSWSVWYRHGDCGSDSHRYMFWKRHHIVSVFNLSGVKSEVLLLCLICKEGPRADYYCLCLLMAYILMGLGSVSKH